MVLVPVLDLRRDGRYHLQAYLARPEHSSPGVDTFTRRGQVRWLPLTGTAATGHRLLLRISLSANRSDLSRVRSGIFRHQRCHTLSMAAKTDPAWQLNLTPGPVAGVQIGSKVSTSQAPLIFCSPTRTELAVLVGAAGTDLLIDEGQIDALSRVSDSTTAPATWAFEVIFCSLAAGITVRPMRSL